MPPKKQSLSSLRISTRLLLLNLLFSSVFFLVVSVIVIFLKEARQILTDDEMFVSAGSMVLIISLMVVLFLAIGTNFLFHRTINRPMNALLEGLKSFSRDGEGGQLDLGRNDEWLIIETAFNKMASDLSSSYRALSSSEKRFRELSELLPQPVFELDREGAFTFSNQRVTDIFEYETEELLNGVHIYQLVDPPWIEQVHLMIGKVIGGREIEGEEAVAMKKSGSLVPIQVYCAPINSQGKIVGIRGTVVDITEQKQSEKELAEHRDLLEMLVEKRTIALRQALSELRESEELYRNLTTQMHDGFIILDEQFRFEYINPSMLALMGYDREELLGMDMFQFRTEENGPLLLDVTERMIKTGESVRFEGRFFSKNGELKTFLASGRPEFEGERLIRVYAICTDISRLMESEQALKFNQESLEEKIQLRTSELEIARDKAEAANQLKNEFLANVSHELRTPMHAILSYSKFGTEKFDIKSKKRIKEYFANIHISGKRLLVFLNDLLDLSSLQEEKADYNMEYSNLRRTFWEMKKEILPLLQEKDLYIFIDEEPGISLTYDSLKIKQVISNLFNNAIKFAEVGSEIKVEFEEASDRVSVRVQNKGVSIPLDELKTIFDPFVQSSITKTGAGGTGLGLPICQKIIEHHGGDIWAEENDQGATFCFFLPIQPPATNT